jgi:hypothetical protein
MDVSVLNEYIDSEPFAFLTQTTNGFASIHVRSNSTTNVGFYIKYREVWTGSAEAQTSDSANPSWAAKGARQIGETYGGYLKEYSEPNATPTRKFLTKFLRPSIWQGRKFTLSYIDSEALASPQTVIKKTRYNADGSVWGATYDIPEGSGAVLKSIYEIFEDATALVMIRGNKEVGAGTSWSMGQAPQVTLAPGTSSKTWICPLNLLQDKSYPAHFIYSVIGGPGGEQIRVNFNVVSFAGVSRFGATHIINQGATSDNNYVILPTVGDANIVTISADNINGGVNSRTLIVTLMTVTVPVAQQIDLRIVTQDAAIPMTETLVSEVLTAPIKELGDNPVQLFWKNSVGGDANWVFDFSQEKSYTTRDGGKRKRMILFASGLTDNEWEGLNEINTIGEVYRPAINELTSSVNKTHVRRGAQVYMVDGSGNKIGVIVIPTEIPTMTRRIQHRIEITIDLPERNEPR